MKIRTVKTFTVSLVATDATWEAPDADAIIEAALALIDEAEFEARLHNQAVSLLPHGLHGKISIEVDSE